MGTKQEKVKKTRGESKQTAPKAVRTQPLWMFSAKISLLSMLILICAYWTFEPALRAVIASLSLNDTFLSSDLGEINQEALNVRRRIQKHYLEYDVYMPLEDIIVPIGPAADPSKNRLTFLMRNVCGSAKIYVWVPIKIRVPVFGNMIWEWCWKPKLKDL
jgi:hypothetical protein